MQRHTKYDWVLWYRTSDQGSAIIFAEINVVRPGNSVWWKRLEHQAALQGLHKWGYTRKYTNQSLEDVMFYL